MDKTSRSLRGLGRGDCVDSDFVPCLKGCSSPNYRSVVEEKIFCRRVLSVAGKEQRQAGNGSARRQNRRVLPGSQPLHPCPGELDGICFGSKWHCCESNRRYHSTRPV